MVSWNFLLQYNRKENSDFLWKSQLQLRKNKVGGRDRIVAIDDAEALFQLPGARGPPHPRSPPPRPDQPDSFPSAKFTSHIFFPPYQLRDLFRWSWCQGFSTSTVEAKMQLKAIALNKYSELHNYDPKKKTSQTRRVFCEQSINFMSHQSQRVLANGMRGRPEWRGRRSSTSSSSRREDMKLVTRDSGSGLTCQTVQAELGPGRRRLILDRAQARLESHRGLAHERSGRVASRRPRFLEPEPHPTPRSGSRMGSHSSSESSLEREVERRRSCGGVATRRLNWCRLSAASETGGGSGGISRRRG